MNWLPVKYFPIEYDLSQLSNFLHSRGLEHRITEEKGQQCLAILDSNQLAALQTFLESYEKGEVNLELESNSKNQAVSAHSTQRLSPSLLIQIRATPVVPILILLSGLGAALTGTAWGEPFVFYFTFLGVEGGYFIPLQESVSSGEIWRFLTPIFIHFGIFHFLFNSLWMWDLGRRIELLQGKWHFLLFVVITGVVSNLAQFFWSGPSLFGGMSGVVYALVGFIAIRQRLVPHPLMAVPNALIGFMLFWLVLCMTGAVDYFIGGSVANAAHLGGLLIGGLYALLSSRFYRNMTH